MINYKQLSLHTFPSWTSIREAWVVTAAFVVTGMVCIVVMGIWEAWGWLPPFISIGCWVIPWFRYVLGWVIWLILLLPASICLRLSDLWGGWMWLAVCKKGNFFLKVSETNINKGGKSPDVKSPDVNVISAKWVHVIQVRTGDKNSMMNSGCNKEYTCSYKPCRYFWLPLGPITAKKNKCCVSFSRTLRKQIRQILTMRSSTTPYPP